MQVGVAEIAVVSLDGIRTLYFPQSRQEVKERERRDASG